MDLDVNVQELLKVNTEKCECGGRIVPAKTSEDRLLGKMKECDTCGKSSINGEEVDLFSFK